MSASATRAKHLTLVSPPSTSKLPFCIGEVRGTTWW
jgi:hypothetical protein